MSAGGSRHQDALCPALCAARDALHTLLDEARLKFEELGSKFTEDGISVLVGGLAIYEDFFKRANLEDRNALELAIKKGPKTVQVAASELLDIEDEWNRFLGEVEGKEKVLSTLIDVGDVLPSSFTLHRVPHSPHTTTAAADDGASNAETLENILVSSQKNAILFVLNRHFA